VLNSNYELLLRHRAVLFGIVGGVMLYSAFTKRNYTLAVVTGLTSMISFVILAMVAKGEINDELNRVMLVDLVGIVVLLIGCVTSKIILYFIIPKCKILPPA